MSNEKTTPARRIDWRDIGFVLEWGGPRPSGKDVLESSDTWMNFRLFEILRTVPEDGPESEWPILLQRKNDTTMFDSETRELSDAAPLLDGHIKWDGCMHVVVREHFHIDEREWIRNLAEALERIRDLMREIDPEVEGR